MAASTVHPLLGSQASLWLWEGMPKESDSYLTVEDYEKWYCLYLVHLDGRVERVDFDVLHPFTEKSPYVDHVPNPAAVERLAAARGWHIAERAMETMVGRWVAEAQGWTLDRIE